MGNVACLRCPDSARCFAEGHCYMLEPASITPPPPRPLSIGWKTPTPQDNSYPASVTTPHGFGCVVRPLPVTMEPSVADDPNPGPRAMGWISPDRAARIREALNRAQCSDVEEFVSGQIATALDLLKA